MNYILQIILIYCCISALAYDDDCKMPNYRCNKPYAMLVRCLQKYRTKKKCAIEMEKKRKCNNQCNIGDGIDFYKYKHIWGKSKKYDRQFSVAEIHSSAATPNKVWHTTCKYCSYNNNNIQFHLENEDQKTTFDNIKTIGSSRHASLALDPDICMITHEVDYSGKGLSFATDCERVISIPTFILPVWSITNVFHLYADLIFPLMTIFYKHYDKKIPENNLIFVEACHEWQTGKLQRILRGDYSAFGDSPVQILLNIASMNHEIPVFAKGHLDELSGRTCFANDVHVGTHNIDTTLDFGLSKSIHKGPEEALMKVDDNYLDMKDYSYREDLEKRYQIHRWSMEYILNNLFKTNLKRNTAMKPNLVLVIERHGTREIVNQKEMDKIIDKIMIKNKLAWKGTEMTRLNVALEKERFTNQLRMFQQTAILITVHGQGAANSIFLPSKCKSAMLLIMPKTWFGWRFLYANMALSSGVHVVMYRRPEDKDIDGYDGTGNNDLVNPNRDLNMTLNENIFRASFVSAVQLVGSKKKKESIAEESELIFPKCVGCYY